MLDHEGLRSWLCALFLFRCCSSYVDVHRVLFPSAVVVQSVIIILSVWVYYGGTVTKGGARMSTCLVKDNGSLYPLNEVSDKSVLCPGYLFSGSPFHVTCRTGKNTLSPPESVAQLAQQRIKPLRGN